MDGLAHAICTPGHPRKLIDLARLKDGVAENIVVTLEHLQKLVRARVLHALRSFRIECPLEGRCNHLQGAAIAFQRSIPGAGVDCHGLCQLCALDKPHVALGPLQSRSRGIDARITCLRTGMSTRKDESLECVFFLKRSKCLVRSGLQIPSQMCIEKQPATHSMRQNHRYAELSYPIGECNAGSVGLICRAWICCLLARREGRGREQQSADGEHGRRRGRFSRASAVSQSKDDPCCKQISLRSSMCWVSTKKYVNMALMSV